jgi:hypothetical protein
LRLALMVLLVLGLIPLVLLGLGQMSRRRVRWWCLT